MPPRGYVLIDFTPPPGLWPDRDRVVRFMEYVRRNFTRIVKGVPAGCELDLLAGGHAHNPGLVPLLGLWAPADLPDRLPDAFVMINEVNSWCSKLLSDEINSIVAATAAPTWDQLVRVRVYPAVRQDA